MVGGGGGRLAFGSRRCARLAALRLSAAASGGALGGRPNPACHPEGAQRPKDLSSGVRNRRAMIHPSLRSGWQQRRWAAASRAHRRRPTTA